MRPILKDFNSFHTEDYVNDPNFVRWVNDPTPTLDQYWTNVKRQYPEQVSNVEEAIQLIRHLRIQRTKLDESDLEDMWQTIQVRTLRKKSRISFKRIGIAASVLIGSVLIGLFIRDRNDNDLKLSTGLGQTRVLILPDSSEVTLNANSTLHYNKNWDDNATREVWLDGEGFFKVKHLNHGGQVKKHERFIVHSKDLNIEVLGTTFNVQEGHGVVDVALINGKVMLSSKSDRQGLVMQPGDVFQYTLRNRIIAKSAAKARECTFWQNGRLEFKDTPATSIFKYIEQSYGYTVHIRDVEVKNKRLSGVFSNNNLDALLKGIEMTLNITVVKDSLSHKITVTNN